MITDPSPTLESEVEVDIVSYLRMISSFLGYADGKLTRAAIRT